MGRVLAGQGTRCIEVSRADSRRFSRRLRPNCVRSPWLPGGQLATDGSLRRQADVDQIADHPALAPAPNVTINIVGMPATEQAEIIRQALPGTAGEKLTDRRKANRREVTTSRDLAR
jgi:hypothetical protein